MLTDRLGREIHEGDIVLWYAPSFEGWTFPGLVLMRHLHASHSGLSRMYIVFLDDGGLDICYDSGYCRCLELLECS